MSISIAGTGLVSALGRGWPAPANCPAPTVEEMGDRRLPTIRVPDGTTRDIDALPRLRRSGDISRFAVAAACDAVASLDPALLPDLPLIFATTDGGVGHTTRFFAPIDASGCGNGSPLLFPETVYNAPASHVAARLGLSAEATTLVGDSSIALAAVCAACDLISSGLVPAALVVAANECDPVACAAYSRSGVCADSPTSQLPPLTGGAAAVLLSSLPGSPTTIERWIEGPPVRSATHAPRALSALIHHLMAPPTPPTPQPPVIVHATGSIARDIPFPRFNNLPGEGLAFTDLAQLVVAAGGATPNPDLLVLSLGFHGQNVGLRLTQRYATP